MRSLSSLAQVPPELWHGTAAAEGSKKLTALVAAQADIYGTDCDLESAMRIVATKALSLTDAAGSVVEMQDGNELVYRACTGTAEGKEGTRIALAGSLSGQAIKRGEVLRCDDSEVDSRVNQAACRAVGLRSMVVVPLLHRRVAVGVLKVLSSEPNAFDEGDVALLELAAGVLAAAIARASDREAREALVRERERAAQEREATARALEESHAALAAVFDGFPGMLGMVESAGDDDLRFLAANPVTLAFLGKSSQEVVGRTAKEAGSPASSRAMSCTHFARAQATGRPSIFELERQHPSGNRFLQGIFSPLPSVAGRLDRCVFIVHDNTDQMRMQKAADLNERLAVAGQLAAGMAHEANNPLACVTSNLAFASSLVARHQTLNAVDWADVQDALTEASEGAERVRQIIKALYTFTLAKQSALAPVDVSAVVDRTLSLVRATLPPEVKVTQKQGPAKRVLANHAQLSHALVNLLMNARQALELLPPATRPLEIEVATGMSEDGRVCIAVTDNGVGMTPEVRARIFDPFFTTRKIGQGQGLGMSVTLNLVKSHGGDVQIDSSPRGGTTVRVLLPVMT